MKIVILAGGSGTRLFPLSRINYPKQFLNIDSDLSLLGETLKRFLFFVKPEDIIIVTGKKYYFYVKSILEQLDSLKSHVISEPAAKNTAPAIILTVKYMLEKLEVSEEENFFIAPADHIIRPIDKFAELVKQSSLACDKGYICTLGIQPNKPETGYGYIKKGSVLDNDLYTVEKFIEKPDLEKAEAMFKEGDYLWNSGMYTFKIRHFLSELKKHTPSLYEIYERYDFKSLYKNFNEFESISIDYALSEKSNEVAVIPFSIYWNDVGSWDAIFEMMEKDIDGNVQIGNDILMVDCKNSFVMSNERLITALGIEDLIVVETDDIIMVTKKGSTQDVKKIVEEIKERKEAKEHTAVFRSWGTYKIIHEGENHIVKAVTINPGKSLKLHSHNKRSEHWVITEGIASIIIGDDDEKDVRANESIYVPKGTKHKISNHTDKPLKIIEVQNGNYLDLDEKDIIIHEQVEENIYYDL